MIDEFRKIHHETPRWVIVLLVAAGLGFFAYKAAGLILILLSSVFMAYLLNVIVNRLESLGLKRSVAVVLLYLILVGIVVGAEILLSPYLQTEIKDFYSKITQYSARIEHILSPHSEDTGGGFPLSEESIRKLLSEMIRPGILFARTLTPSDLLNQTAPFVLGLVLTPFFVFFMLKDWPVFSRRIMAGVPPAHVEKAVSVICEVNILAGRYLRGVAIDCLVVGALATGGLWALDFSYPIVLGILTGAVNIIPVFGPLMACVATCLIAMIETGSWGSVIPVIALFMAIRLADDLLVQPVTIGKSVHLHPMLLVITILAGERLFGVMGMVFAVPVVTVAQRVAGILAERRTGGKASVDKGSSARPIIIV